MSNDSLLASLLYKSLKPSQVFSNDLSSLSKKKLTQVHNAYGTIIQVCSNEKIIKSGYSTSVMFAFACFTDNPFLSQLDEVLSKYATSSRSTICDDDLSGSIQSKVYTIDLRSYYLQEYEILNIAQLKRECEKLCTKDFICDYRMDASDSTLFVDELDNDQLLFTFTKDTGNCFCVLFDCSADRIIKIAHGKMNSSKLLCIK
jgi:hypothetical protein